MQVLVLPQDESRPHALKGNLLQHGMVKALSVNHQHLQCIGARSSAEVFSRQMVKDDFKPAPDDQHGTWL